MDQQPTAAPMINQIAGPATRTAAWGALGLGAIALAIATLRNLLGGD